jgi:hypothetical protein
LRHAAIDKEIDAVDEAAVVGREDLTPNSDVDTRARYVQTVNFGLTVQASTGATRKELLRIVEIALKAWPK